ncbi:MAG: extracellular solute-binding protein [Actinobacteria bacterium]|nr:extracellular solute-binding protein [Actinomycetota bacterium]
MTSQPRRGAAQPYRSGVNRREFLGLGAGLGAAALLGGCSGSGGDSSGGGELTFWTFVDDHATFMKSQAKEFNKTTKGPKVTVKASVYDYDQMHDKLLTALQSGVGAPDVVDIEIAKFGTFTRGEIQLHDLTKLVDKHRKNLVETRLAPYQFNGKQYGLDYHLGAFVMYYNTDVLREANVDPDNIETWDDFIAAGKTVKKKTGKWMTTVEAQNRLVHLALMLQNGGGIYDKNNKLILDSQANVDALQLAADMVHKHEIATSAPGGGQSEPPFYKAFNAGKFACHWYPQWQMIRFPDFMPDTKGKLLVRPLPTFSAGGAVSTMGGGTGTAITKHIDEEKVDVAMDFLEFAKITYDAQVKIWTELGFDPYREDVYDDPALSKPDPWFSNEPVMKNLEKMFDRLTPEYTGPRYPEAVQLINETVAFNIVKKGASVSDELSSAVETVERKS